MNVQKLRALSRVLLLLLMGVHMVTWYVLSIHAVGSIGIEGLFSGLSRGIVNAAFVFWITMFVSAFLLGRVFCGWFCWFGGYLELVEWGVVKLRVRVPGRGLLYLGVIPFVGLAIKVYNSLLVNWFGHFPTMFVFRLGDVEPWGGQQTGISIVITLILFGPVLLFVYGPRAWCRYLCPIGALMKTFGKPGIGKVRLVNDECIGCGNCNRACSMQVNVLGELRTHSEVRNSDCIRCFRCTDQCPKEAIAYGFIHREASLSADATTKAEQASLKWRNRSVFDVAIVAVWSGVTVLLTLAGVSQNAPQEIKVVMAPALLLLIYGFALTVQTARVKSGEVLAQARDSPIA